MSLSRRLLEPSTSLLTGVSNIACSEGSLLETRVEELSELQLERVCSMEEAKFPELQFSRGYALDNNKQILIVTQRHLAYHPPFGYVSRARITFQEDGSYTVHILMRVLQNIIDIVYIPRRRGLTKSQKPSTLRAHFTHAYRALDTLPNHYY